MRPPHPNRAPFPPPAFPSRRSQHPLPDDEPHVDDAPDAQPDVHDGADGRAVDDGPDAQSHAIPVEAAGESPFVALVGMARSDGAFGA